MKKNYLYKTIAFCVGWSALAYVSVLSIKSMGEEVYKGKINDYSIVYEEGRHGLKNLLHRGANIMTVQKDSMTYVFDDRYYATKIDWKNEQKPDFEKDCLESVIIRRGNSAKEYSNYTMSENPTSDTLTLNGKKTKEVFDNANLLYNNLRAKIREELRSTYVLEQQPYIDSFKK